MWTILLLAILIGNWALNLLVATLDRLHGSGELPAEMADVWDAEGYERAIRYGRARSRLGVIADTVGLVVTVIVIFSGLLNAWDQWLRSLIAGELLRGLAFWTGIVVGLGLLNLPFSIYRTFVIEAAYGFNRSTPAQFAKDLVLAAGLSAILGLPLLALVLWLFAVAGGAAWLWAWAVVVIFQFTVAFLAPRFIMPLFNKFEPLPPGELRDAIESYAREQGFALGGIFTMDGSKRSAKSNAFFTGFGQMRRIVLFDTLVEKHTVRELLAVLAHEMGHYRLGHIWKGLALGIGINGLLFFLLSLLIGNPDVAAAFRMEDTSIYASLLFVGVFFTPISLLLGALSAAMSRRFEFQADRYAATTLPDGGTALANGLKRLAADNLADLEPHPLDVILHHSHPPILQRLEALEPYRDAGA